MPSNKVWRTISLSIVSLLGLAVSATLVLAAGGGDGAEQTSMVSIDINASLFWQVGNFLLLLVALNYLLYKPIRGIIAKRAEKVAQLGSDITSSEEGVKAKAGELEAQLAEARKEGMTTREEMKSEGHDKEREIIDAATAEMEKTVAKIREEISAEIGAARDELKGQVQSFGQELAQKILGRSIQ